MNKEQLQEIKNLATFIFDDTRQYNRFLRFITESRFTASKQVLDKVIEGLILDINYHENNEVFVSQYKKADELLTILIDLTIEEGVTYGERKSDRAVTTE